MKSTCNAINLAFEFEVTKGLILVCYLVPAGRERVEQKMWKYQERHQLRRIQALICS